ncbi:MAG: flagellar motor switch phosphatase FliY, partial [Vallitaleaceae bacterium]|nr:flagellar motor switch phosphatase FliY [Vallitaleaceae bacterium]
MDDMLSQEEINALLRGLDVDEPKKELITADEKDAIGEVSNISMGTAATTLFSLVNQKVLITTPQVSITTWNDIVEMYKSPCVAIQIVYKEGLKGTNLLILKENDVRIIADLMMGGDGLSPDEELNDLHLSAIGEAMNQMIGSAATSMSSMFHKKIDIQPPASSHIDLNESFDPADIAEFLTGDFIKVAFHLQIGELVDSEMMQLYPTEFAKDIYSEFMNTQVEEEPKKTTPSPEVKTEVPMDSTLNSGMQG